MESWRQKIEARLVKMGLKLQQNVIEAMVKDVQLWKDIEIAEEEEYWNGGVSDDPVGSVLYTYSVNLKKKQVKAEPAKAGADVDQPTQDHDQGDTGNVDQ